jgi:amidase
MEIAQKAISRRAFLGAGLAAGAAVATGRLEVPSWAATRTEPWIEASIPELQRLMRRRRLTSRELTLGYLRRIESLNPLLGAVIETNPAAVSIAARRDKERRAGHIRGPLHGIPVLLKDNIATDDRMRTTAGSLALVNSRVPADAVIVARLRAAGAVVLGKANLSEWANFRGFAPFNGWSARGGFTRDPYLLSFDPCGSSSGSAVAPAANLCAVAVGTETDGSIVYRRTGSSRSRTVRTPQVRSAAPWLMSPSSSARWCPRSAARGNWRRGAVRGGSDGARCAARASALTGATSPRTMAANPI